MNRQVNSYVNEKVVDCEELDVREKLIVLLRRT